MTHPSEVACMVVVTTRITYCSQISHIYQTETSGNPYSGLKTPSQTFWMQKHPKCSGVARGGVHWEVIVPTVMFSGSKAFIYGWMSAEGVRELCFINAVMNSHTTVWWNTKTWNRWCYPPLIPCIVGHQHGNEDIHSPKVKILQLICISLNLSAPEQLLGIL